MGLPRTCLLSALALGACLACCENTAYGWLARASRARGCVPLGAVERTGSAACWASWRLPGEPGRLCIPREVWLQELSSAGATSTACGEWPGSWRESAAPLNSPERPPGTDAGLPRVRATFFASAPPFPAPPERAILAPLRDSAALKLENARESAAHLLEPYDRLGLLRLLVTGTRISGPQADLLALLIGLRPLLASGLHLFGLAAWIDRWALELAESGLAPPWVLLPLSRALAAAIGLAAWLLAGARPGMLRPWIAWTLREGARRAGVRWRPWAPVTLAALGEAAWARATGRPSAEHALLAGIAAWAVFAGAPRRGRGWLRESAVTALAAAAGSALLGAWKCGLLALSAPLSATFLLPLSIGFAYPLALASCGLHALGSTSSAAVLARLDGVVVSGLALAALQAALALPVLWVVGRGALAWGAGGAALGILWAAFARTRRGVLPSAPAVTLGAAALVALVAASAWTAPRGDGARPGAEAPALSVTQLDVGQGDSALVRAPRSAGLVDAGAESALGDGAWMRLLAARGIAGADWVALTHLDEDHVGGLRRLARLLPVGCVETSALELATPRGQRLAAELRADGVELRSWRGGCVPYPTLPPPGESGAHAAGGGETAAKHNEHMGAIFIPLARGGFYLSAGDADSGDEPRIGAWAASLGEDLGSPRILKVSHHGSRTSSDPVFLARVRPDSCWISVGTGNRYGHPSPETLVRLEASGCAVRRTDKSGRIELLRAAGDRRRQ